MFFRAIGLTLGFATLLAFGMASMTLEAAPKQDNIINGKRQDRLVPAGGFKAAQDPSQIGYGTYSIERR